MAGFGRACRGWIGLAVLACGVVVALPSGRAAAQGSADVPALPGTLTRESARDLLSRLSDAQVRSLLLEQLDRTAAAPATPAAATGPATMAGMAGTVDQHAGAMRDRYGTLYDALLAVPATVGAIAARIAGGRAAELASLAGYIAVLLVTGWLAERVYVYAIRNYRRRLRDASAPTFTARTFQLGVGLVLDLGAIATFGATAIVVFFAWWLADELQRVVVLEVLFAVVIVRLAALFARFLLAGDQGRRLLPLDDSPARTLRRYAVALAAVFGAGVATIAVFAAGGATAETGDLVAIAFWAVGVVLTLIAVWHVRAPIADLIRGDGTRGAVAGWLADLWPVAATAYLLALLAGGVFNLLAGTAITTGTGFASVALVIALPIVDLALCRALAAAAGRRVSAGVSREPLAAYEPVFRRAIHIVVIVGGLLLVARLWDVDPFALAQRSLGGRITSALFGIGIVLLVTYMLWELVRTAIDRRLLAEGELQDDVPATRLRTVLPILRATILVTIVVMATMSVLAALGVDILPLLAGAGVVGVAIGFGSQTLVRDIVSGAFFLMDDAFRLGEYIEVGDAKGRVERINLRSVFLRHHRGALNIVPYGEIKRLRNTDRDWSIHVLEFRLTYDTNMLQVKKILKEIGDELAADPDYAHDILKPLKSGGVIAAEDSAIVVRGKFTARPGNNAWVVRRVAYDKIIRAFRAAGIRFAHRQVTVNVPDAHDAATAAAAGAAPAGDGPAVRTMGNAPQT